MPFGHTVSTGPLLSGRRHPVYDSGSSEVLPGPMSGIRRSRRAGATLEEY
jgi:hypothetical protein